MLGDAIILSGSPQSWNSPSTNVEQGFLIGFRLGAMESSLFGSVSRVSVWDHSWVKEGVGKGSA